MTDEQKPRLKQGEDASFEDGVEIALRLKAHDKGDLDVMAALLQDAIVPHDQIRFDPKRREFAFLANRFRWEDRPGAPRPKGDFERVQAVVLVRDVRGVASRGTKADVLNLLTMQFTAGEDGTGHLHLEFAGDFTARLDVETLDITLKDVTRPYLAPSKRAPDHQI